MGLGGVAIATLPSVICAKLMFSDGLGGWDFFQQMCGCCKTCHFDKVEPNRGIFRAAQKAKRY